MEERLLNIYDRASDWLKFAEAKNAGLVAFNAAVVAGLVSSAGAFDFLGCAKWYCLVPMILALLVSATISLFAMIPRLAFIEQPISETSGGKSVFFFEHIQKWYATPSDYLRAIALAEGNGSTRQWTDLELDLAGQVIQISCIGTRKYSHFRIAAWITVFVVGLIVFGIGLLIWRRIKK